MSDKEYIKELETQNDVLHRKLEKFDLMSDIIKSRVNIVESNFFKLIHPKQLCQYMESLGWTQKYEKMHERFLTRCYLSPHKDAKCKVYLQDTSSPETVRLGGADGIPAKVKESVNILARLHKKGEMEVIFEILSTKGE
jgi:hypothetical protein